MTNTPYKLTDNVRKFFEFDIDGVIYKMSYPTGEQRKEIARIGGAIQSAVKKAEKLDEESEELKKLQSEAEKLGQEMTDLIDSMTTSNNDKAEKISVVLEDQPTPVVRNYYKMIEAELSMELPQNA